jgi:nucleoside-diphosphate-sugar epimerase
MPRIVIIGGSGHVGTYLVPALVAAGHEVVNVSRGARQPYAPHPAWGAVRTVTLDREAEDAAGSFGAKIRALEPDIVIDMICFSLASARLLVEALRGRVTHFLSCGTIWVHGPAAAVPTTEAARRTPFGAYGTQKAEIEAFLLDTARRDGFPATVVHPGHIVGPGWRLINPAGHLDPGVFTTLARGEELVLPNFGLETLHHVHAEDVAQVFLRAIAHWSASVGEAFHAVSPQALTLRGYAEGVAGFFGREARLGFLPFEAWKAGCSAEEAAATWEHIARSPSCSIDKARQRLGYAPRYTSLAAAEEAVRWLIADGQVQTG